MDKELFAKQTKIIDAQLLLDLKPVIVRRKDTLELITKRALVNPKVRVIYVVDEQERLCGIISLEKVYTAVFYPIMLEELKEKEISDIETNEITEGKLLIAEDLMQPPVYVYPEETVGEAFLKMFRHRLEELPVVNKDLKVTGCISMLQLLHVWLLSRFRRK